MDYLRKFTAGVKEVEVDAAARFLIPKSLVEYAHIDKEVVLVPLINFIEIWDKEAFEAQNNSIDEVTFMQMTEKIMGEDGRE